MGREYIRLLADVNDSDVDIFPIEGINLEMLRKLNARGADAVVLMLSDEENYELPVHTRSTRRNGFADSLEEYGA